MLSVKEYLKKPRLLLIAILKKSRFFFTDKCYLEILYYLKMNRVLHFKNPKTFNEKIQWLKIYDRNPMYTKLVDKIQVKEYIMETLGCDVVIPTLGVWDKFEDIDWDILPEKFVLKTNHSGGSTGVVICKDKSNFDKLKAGKILERSLQTSIYPTLKEWPYKNIRPQIFAEEYMEDSSGELRDYKFLCFNGIVKCSFVCLNRRSKGGLCLDFYDRDWNKMPFRRHYPNSNITLERPLTYDQMIKCAELLARGIKFVRVDFYEIKGKLYFGEITFYPGSGFEEFTPEKWDYELGSWLKL